MLQLTSPTSRILWEDETTQRSWRKWRRCTYRRMPYKVLRHEVGVAALDPRVLQIPIDSFVQPHVNGTGPSNAVECDGHGIGRCRTCMVSLIASARFACQTMSGQAAVWGTSTSHGTRYTKSHHHRTRYNDFCSSQEILRS